MDKLKIAHIGTGNRGTGAYLPLIAKLKDDLELVAVCDLHKDSVKEQGEKYNIAAYTDTAEMLEKREARYLLHRDYAEQQSHPGAAVL